MSGRKTTWRVSGMHCPGCETAVLRAVSPLPGVRAAAADWRRGTLTAVWDNGATAEDVLAKRIADAGYTLEPMRSAAHRRLRAAGILLAAGALFVLLELTPLRALLSAFPVAREGMRLIALFALGLMTSLHCVAMCGGINLAQSTAAARSNGRATLPNLLYNLGRVLSYTLVGGVVGALGSVLRISSAVQSGIQIAAAVLMLGMALRLLDAGGVSVALSGSLRTRLLRAGHGSSLWIGLVNGLMPCGPLQAMQLYALSSGSWWMGALSMLLFSLGTVPLMLTFGWVSARLNRRFAKPMQWVSGALLLTMAVAMLCNGLALAGVQLRARGDRTEEFTALTSGVQAVYSELEWRGYPNITVQAGTPVRWTIHAAEGRITGCNKEMVIPALALRVPLKEGDNVVEFTASTPGVIDYTCWMGMLYGSITVLE